MIKGVCKTNVDALRRVSWPTTFAALPRKGDLVEGYNTGVVAKIVSVWHCQKMVCSGDASYPDRLEPFIKLEITQL